jgi:ABC-type multidrug transport system ATPase subunit
MKLSGGVQRLAGFAMAIVWPGRLVILDEPTNDVDPLRRRRLWQLIRRLGNDGTAVLLVTHNVLEAEQVVDRLVIIDEHRAGEAIQWAQSMVARGSVEEYSLAATSLEDVCLRLIGRDDALENTLEGQSELQPAASGASA